MLKRKDKYFFSNVLVFYKICCMFVEAFIKSNSQ